VQSKAEAASVVLFFMHGVILNIRRLYVYRIASLGCLFLRKCAL